VKNPVWASQDGNILMTGYKSRFAGILVDKMSSIDELIEFFNELR
jgi:hypothetical protein